MNKVRIVTDSSCDLPPSILKQWQVTVVPLVFRFGDEVFFDGELSPDEFWEKAKGPFHPQTSQPSVGAFEEVFAQLVGEGAEVVCLTITSKHSGTYNSAWTAAQRFPGKVTVFDSLSLSWGLGFQVLAAAQAAQEGKSPEEIAELIEDIQRRTHIIILLNTMENIKRGGRADKIIPVLDRVARVLNIKPILNFVDGEIKLLTTARSYEKGLKKIEEEALARAPFEKAAVLHTRRPDIAAHLAQALAQKAGFPKEEIPVTETGAVLASHGGEGVVAAIVVSQSRSS